MLTKVLYNVPPSTSSKNSLLHELSKSSWVINCSSWTLSYCNANQLGSHHSACKNAIPGAATILDLRILILLTKNWIISLNMQNLVWSLEIQCYTYMQCIWLNTNTRWHVCVFARYRPILYCDWSEDLYEDIACYT